jgi:hypothetical protein
MTEQSYHGSCQCQAVEFEAALDLDHTITCNCSRCQRLGSVLAFTPLEKFTITKGEGATTQYLFNKGAIRHQFCPVCGIQPFAFAKGKDGVEMAAINVNCLEGVDPRALKSHHYDGRAA